MADFAQLRAEMVRQQIAARGITDARVLAAMGKVPREELLPEHIREFAYDDLALPIPHGQTMSQPYVVALMIAMLALEGGERVLEIGTGSGYSAAVLAEIAGEVITIERNQQLADTARDRLAALGYQNIQVHCGDGSRGVPERAPYRGIVVTAGGPQIPGVLLDQLDEGGRLVMPVGTLLSQVLTRVVRTGEKTFEQDALHEVRFVPLFGEQGWQPNG